MLTLVHRTKASRAESPGVPALKGFPDGYVNQWLCCAVLASAALPPSGHPALLIPGNAGSYEQVCAAAAGAAAAVTAAVTGNGEGAAAASGSQGSLLFSTRHTPALMHAHQTRVFWSLTLLCNPATHEQNSLVTSTVFYPRSAPWPVKQPV